jgi:hypothetical protein
VKRCPIPVALHCTLHTALHCTALHCTAVVYYCSCLLLRLSTSDIIGSGATKRTAGILGTVDNIVGMGDARGRLIIVKAPASVREAADVVAEVVVHEQTGLIAAPADTTTKQNIQTAREIQEETSCNAQSS